MSAIVPATSSYHTPIILWHELKASSGSSFKFEAFYEEHEDCDKVIREGWNSKAELERPGTTSLKKQGTARGQFRIGKRLLLNKQIKRFSP
ncbi:hypothetical protein SESBI_23403 [Sesbania bispinosa]|nr:hypothetical protein SESBI_23403 [Sesbania bispinosa]